MRVKCDLVSSRRTQLALKILEREGSDVFGKDFPLES
jgi:hypothetical protein